MNYSDNMENSEILPEVKNWGLREVIDKVTVIDQDSIKYREYILEKLGLPSPGYDEFNKSQTDIGWNKMPNHYKFFFDKEGCEVKIKNSFESSELKQTENLIIVSSGRREAVILLPKQVFFDHWDNIIAGAIWQIIIFSEDFKLIMETSSNDYYLHSNFKIMEEE